MIKYDHSRYILKIVDSKKMNIKLNMTGIFKKILDEKYGMKY